MALPDAELEALWKRVVDQWDDQAAHGAFLDHCQSRDQLAEAAARYRGMSGDRERGDAAKKRLQGVTILALARLESERTVRDESGRNRLGGLVLLALIAGALALLLGYLRVHR